MVLNQRRPRIIESRDAKDAPIACACPLRGPVRGELLIIKDLSLPENRLASPGNGSEPKGGRMSGDDRRRPVDHARAGNTPRTRVPPLVGRRQERAAHTAHKASSGEGKRRTKEGDDNGVPESGG